MLHGRASPGWVVRVAVCVLAPAGWTAAQPWSFAPIGDPPVPAVRNASWPSTSIDAFILERLERQASEPAAPADRRTLLRRLTFDLTGLPPTPEEIAAFEDELSPDASSRVVDRLLGSPRYGEHWGRHWLDVARYADTAGDTADYPLPEAWRYRNYVIAAFNADKPYDELLREQIAGDILARRGPRELYAERVAATGFLALSRRFGFDSENYHHLTLQDTIDTLGQSVLGLTLGCARCHDHKTDPLTMQDYYGLYGIFASTRFAFPGSEQKTRYRAMVPLVPCEESQPRWRELQASFAALGRKPDSVLRSLDDIDGDFEMQRPASGGSYGVLVPPWLYSGKVTVAEAAQSPFKNVHPFGSVGVGIPPEAGEYAIRQRFHPSRSRGLLYVSLDVRVSTDRPAARGRHRFAVGAHGGSFAVEAHLGVDELTLITSGEPQSLRLPKPGDWHQLQLVLDLDARTCTGSLGAPGQLLPLASCALAQDWKGGIDYVAVDSQCGANAGLALPGLAIDNIAVGEVPFAPVSIRPAVGAAPERTIVELSSELQGLVGMDGDFEAQKDGAAPSGRWHPGPNSAVKVSAAAQSPFRNVHPGGTLGIRLPATAAGAYNGFGQELPRKWQASDAERLHVSFDFRCLPAQAGETGAWRFHLGHSHAVPAVELELGATQVLRRSGDERSSAASLEPGAWHQVQLSLDLRARTYTGSVATPAATSRFSGSFAGNWDGTIDYAFIDSGASQGGGKPALEADNFLVTEKPLQPLPADVTQHAAGTQERQARIEALRREIARRTEEEARRLNELNRELAAGPVALAYAVAEGTPESSRLQQRGEPDRPGAEVPRSFIRSLGGSVLAPDTPGSGRLELAEWLTRPELPLTARVMANRIWHYHFNRGLVATANDFGRRTEPPTHPELLDHLATELLRSGWSVKALHRRIVLSATYGQGCREAGEAVRSAGYSSFERRRLGAEEIRDAILAVSGAIDLVPGREHPFPPAHTWGFTQHQPFAAVYEHDKRSVYLMVQRLKRHPFLALFDGADPNSSTASRHVTTMPTQALYFLNDPFVHAKSQRFARRLRAESAGEPEQIVRAFCLALGRHPTAAEKSETAELLAACRAELAAAGSADPGLEALAAFARTLFGSNEFLHID